MAMLPALPGMGSLTRSLSTATPEIPTPQVQSRFGYGGSGGNAYGGWNYPQAHTGYTPPTPQAYVQGSAGRGSQYAPPGLRAPGLNPQAPTTPGQHFLPGTPGPTPQNYIDIDPNVLAARNALNTQGGLSNQNLQQTMQQALIAFGDPTSFAVGGAASPYKSLADIVGSKFSIDPATSQLATANTIGPGGTIGNSIVAQLHLAAMNSMNQAVTSGVPLGAAVNSSQLGYNVNQANIQSGQAFSNAISNLQQLINPAIQSNLTTQQGLQDALTNAIYKVPFDVAQNPGAFPIIPGTPPQPVTHNGLGGGGIATNQQLQDISNQYGLSTNNYPAFSPPQAPNAPGPRITPSLVQRFRQATR